MYKFAAFLAICFVTNISFGQMRLLRAPLGTICTNTAAAFGNLQPQRTNYTYSWDFGDGNTSTDSAFAYHTYTQPGTYTVTVTLSGPKPAYVLSEVVIHEIPTGWREQGADIDGPDLSLDVIDPVSTNRIFDEIKRNTKGVLPQTFRIQKILDPQLHDLIFEEWDLIGQNDFLGKKVLPLAVGTFRDTIPRGAAGNLVISWVMDTTSVLTDSVVITVDLSPNPANLQLLGDSALCPGETTRIVATRDAGTRNEWFRGSGSYSTSQSDTLLATTGGSFWLRRQLNNCYSYSHDTIRVIGYSVPQADISFVMDTTYICGDTGGVYLAGNHNDPRYAYQWLFDGNPIPAPDGTQSGLSLRRAQEGSYQFIVDAPGDCLNDTSRKVYAKRIPTDSISIYLRSGPTGDTLFASPAVFANYSWYVNGSSHSSTPGKPYLVLRNGEWGSYQVRGFGMNGCWSEYSTVLSVVSQDPLKALPRIQLYPNPTQGECHLRTNRTLLYPTFTLKNLAGKTLHIFKEASGSSWQLDVSQHESGVYLLSGKDQQGARLGNWKLVILNK